MEFNRLDDTNFPLIETVDPFSSQTDFDYISRYQGTQMRIRVLSVPWDLGSVHVGQATIGGIGNVVKFETDEARDAWLDAKRYARSPQEFAQGGFDGIEWETQYRRYHDGDEIRLDLPFNTLSRFNYIAIDYTPASSDSERVDWERGECLKWFYFIREMRWEAVNCTVATLMMDYWQTYINRIDISYMMLERGHAPMALVSADQFLANPIENNQYLLAEDVTYSDASVVKHTANATINSENMRAVVFTTADPRGDYGSKANNTWKVPAYGAQMIDGVPAPTAFSVAPEDLSMLLLGIDIRHPQFKQTIKGIAFISEDLLYNGATFDFCNVTCTLVWGSGETYDLLTLAKSQFGYGDRYENLAKLYTSPYAHIEIVGDDGSVSRLAIEDCSNALSLVAHAQLAYPFIKVDSRLSGAGGAGGTITFRNAAVEQFDFDGRWYEYAKAWSVPVFSVIQQAGVTYDYATHYDRRQQRYAADETKASANESASTAKTNADNSAGTAKTNADNSAQTAYNNAVANATLAKDNANRSADNAVTNAGVQAGANRSITNTNNQAILSNANINASQVTSSTAIANAYIEITKALQVDYAVQSAAISAVGGLAQSAASVAGSLATGNVAGAIAGGIGGIASAACTAANAFVTTNLLESEAEAQEYNNNLEATNTNSYNGLTTGAGTAGRAGIARDVNTVNTSTSNTSLETQTLNSANAIKANARDAKTRADANALATKTTSNTNANNVKTTENTNADNTKRTADNNAQRTHDIATNAITNAIAQANLGAPSEFGTAANGDMATLRPQSVFANIVTQPKSAIRRAGDYFLRFGYSYEGAWEFEDFNVMPHFTFWKCSDMWVHGLNIPDAHIDQIRFLLLGGVTVWRYPEDIGVIGIYDNH